MLNHYYERMSKRDIQSDTPAQPPREAFLLEVDDMQSRMLELETLIDKEQSPILKLQYQTELDALFNEGIGLFHEAYRQMASIRASSYIDKLKPIAFMFGGEDALLDFMATLIPTSFRIGKATTLEGIYKHIRRYRGIEYVFSCRIIADHLSRSKDVTRRMVARDLAKDAAEQMQFYNIGYYETQIEDVTVWGISTEQIPATGNPNTPTIKPTKKTATAKEIVISLWYILKYRMAVDCDISKMANYIWFITQIQPDAKSVNNTNIKDYLNDNILPTLDTARKLNISEPSRKAWLKTLERVQNELLSIGEAELSKGIVQNHIDKLTSI